LFLGSTEWPFQCNYPKQLGRSDRSAQDRSKAKLYEVVQTPVAKLRHRDASRATNADAVRAAETVLTHGVIWKFAD
jgi:hypothetical protein